MFSVREKRLIADKVQELLRSTDHPELPKGEIKFVLEVWGEQDWSWTRISNNAAVFIPDVNPHNESQDKGKEF